MDEAQRPLFLPLIDEYLRGVQATLTEWTARALDQVHCWSPSFGCLLLGVSAITWHGDVGCGPSGWGCGEGHGALGSLEVEPVSVGHTLQHCTGTHTAVAKGTEVSRSQSPDSVRLGGATGRVGDGQE